MSYIPSMVDKYRFIKDRKLLIFTARQMLSIITTRIHRAIASKLLDTLDKRCLK